MCKIINISPHLIKRDFDSLYIGEDLDVISNIKLYKQLYKGA